MSDGNGYDPILRIQLTPGQCTRVKELTGRDMEVYEIEDLTGEERNALHLKTPDEVEFDAVIEARRLNDEDEAEREYVIGLAKEQDDDAKSAKDFSAREKEIKKALKRDQKQTAAKFKLIAQGKMPPDQAAKKKKER